jgi:hypothetical protein
MHIEQAQVHDAQAFVSALQETTQWLVDAGRPMWSPEEFSVGTALFDIEAGIF